MYKVILLPPAEKFYRKLCHTNREILRRIDAALESLKMDPLQGKPLRDQLKGKFLLRVGVYRIIYSVHKKEITVYILDIGHRKEIYRNK